jgi:hypothetical protein
MIEPQVALLLVLMAVGVWIFLVGAVAIGGGVAAIRRQGLLLALLAPVLVGLVLLAPILEQLSGGVAGIVLLGVSALTIGIRLAQRQREPADVKEHRAAAMRSPRVRWLIGGFIAFMVFVSVLAAVLGRLSSQ